MFTNWLTGSSSTSSINSSNSGGSSSRLACSSMGIGVVAGGVAGTVAGGGVMTTPPDVILEVGPAPSSVRFVAHGLVLGMHSGYLRSAIRMDEATTAAAAAAAAAASVTGVATNNVAGAASAGGGELLLYLGNVTAEQFAPLLTYMYTGYLDLNVDNIFAVLLATHVLHMPRALEICRSFLARAQTEGYLSGNPTPISHQLQLQLSSAPITNKIIRPIASKAPMPNFGFLPAPPPAPPPLLPATVAGYVEATAAVAASEQLPLVAELVPEEDEDVEVFIDSNTATDNEQDTEDCNVSVVSSLASSSAASSLNIERIECTKASALTTPITATTTAAATNSYPTTETVAKTTTATKTRRGGNSTRKSLNKRNSNTRTAAVAAGTAGGGLKVAKAPVQAVQLETATPAAKFIIDVASCDGPVRFRRILNTAYGHKPEQFEGGLGSSSGLGADQQQRSQQSVSYSFHQQMARAISSQQRQQQQEENENSIDVTTTTTAAAATAIAATPATGTTTTQRKQTQAELFVCVYCKHTFKSQYCYQKHAKRHLNPLSLDKKLAETHSSRGESNTTQELLAAAAAPTVANASTVAVAATAVATATTTPAATVGATDATLTAAALLRREVRPLDMNVQYYPCKTCGSKFPSYYFVHKHRKLCHADELETNNNNNNNSNNNNNNNSTSSNSSSGGGGNSNSNNASKRETTAAAGASATAMDATDPAP